MNRVSLGWRSGGAYPEEPEYQVGQMARTLHWAACASWFFLEEMQMSKQMTVVKHGEAEELNVMGAAVRFLCGADKTDRGWSLMEVEVPERAGPPPHDHPWDEAYYVVAGEVRFQLDGREQVFKPGDFIYAPGGTVHGFQGASAKPARLIIFDAPAHAESFFRETHRQVKEMPRDLAKALAIGKRHQINFRVPEAA